MEATGVRRRLRHTGRGGCIHEALALVLLFSLVAMHRTEGKKLLVEGSSPDEGNGRHGYLLGMQKSLTAKRLHNVAVVPARVKLLEDALVVLDTSCMPNVCVIDFSRMRGRRSHRVVDV